MLLRQDDFRTHVEVVPDFVAVLERVKVRQQLLLRRGDICKARRTDVNFC